VLAFHRRGINLLLRKEAFQRGHFFNVLGSFGLIPEIGNLFSGHPAGMKKKKKKKRKESED